MRIIDEFHYRELSDAVVAASASLSGLPTNRGEILKALFTLQSLTAKGIAEAEVYIQLCKQLQSAAETVSLQLELKRRAHGS